MSTGPGDRFRCIHADRVAGGHRDHRGPDRVAAAGRAGCARGGAAGAVHQQPEADRPGDRQLRIGRRLHRAGLYQPVRQRQLCQPRLPCTCAVPGYNPDPFTLDNGPGWGWLAMLLPYAEQAPLYNATNVNLPTWVADNSTVVTTQINVFLCPSANNPTPTCMMVDANLNLLPVANQYFARANYQYNMGWNDTSIQPPNTSYDDPVRVATGRSTGTAASLMPG